MLTVGSTGVQDVLLGTIVHLTEQTLLDHNVVAWIGVGKRIVLKLELLSEGSVVLTSSC